MYADEHTSELLRGIQSGRPLTLAEYSGRPLTLAEYVRLEELLQVSQLLRVDEDDGRQRLRRCATSAKKGVVLHFETAIHEKNLRPAA